jgi:hypothetical protein
MYGLHQISTLVAGHCSVPILRFMQVGILAVATCMFGINAAYIRGQFHHIDPLSYLNGRLDRGAYIQRYRPEYKAMQYANKNLPDHAKILAIFLGNRRYYSDKELIFGDGLFRNTVMTAETPENILADLKERNITHILIRDDMFNHWMKQQLNNGSKKILEGFFEHHTHRLFSKAGYGLYQL